jgi:hypothetical protein
MCTLTQFKKTVLPNWVNLALYYKIEKYILSGDMSQFDSASSTELQKLLWVGDLLHLEGFLEKLIQDIIIPRLNE